MGLDEEKRKLERRATAGEDPSDAERVRRSMERTGLTSAAADYLQRYLEIVEAFCGYGGRRYDEDGNQEDSTCLPRVADYGVTDTARRWIGLGEARERLTKLNEEFEGRVDEKMIRKGLPAEQLALDCMGVIDEDEESAWLPSEICY